MGGWASPPKPVPRKKAGVTWALAFSPPHFFRSKLSYSTESKYTTLSIIPLHPSDLLSK